MPSRHWDETWRRLRVWTGGQGPSERLSAQVLLADGFERLDPSQPLGGSDGQKDAVMLHNGDPWIMAVYFPMEPQKFHDVRRKFLSDLNGVDANSATGMAFVCNQRLTVGQKSELQGLANVPVEIYHLERLVAILDMPKMGTVRRRFGLEAPEPTLPTDPDRARLLAATRETYSRFLTDLRLTAHDIPVELTRETSGQPVTAQELLSEINVRDTHGLVVLGPARSGKTFLATWLCDRVSRTSEVLCVIVPLSRWDEDVEIADLLADFMHDELNVTHATARRLTDAGAVFPIFDGVDELTSVTSADRSVLFFRAIDRWQSLPEPRPCLITGRDEVWDLLPRSMRSIARLDVYRLHSIGPDRALSFFEDELRRTGRAQDGTDTRALFASAARHVDLSRPAELAMLTRVATERFDTAGDERVDDRAEALSTSALYGVFLETRLASETNLWGRFRNACAIADLRTYACYLRSNANAVPGGRLKRKDLLLHRLWPVSGARLPRLVDFGIAVTMSAPGLTWLAVYGYHAGSWGLGAVAAFIIGWSGLLARTTWKPWVDAGVPDWSRLRDRRIALRQLTAALVVAGAAWVLSGWAVALAAFVVSWLAIGFTVGFGQTLATNGQIRVLRPGDVLRRELQVSLVAAGAVTPMITLAFSSTWGWQIGVPLSVVYGATVGASAASALWRRYLALIICRLPTLTTPGQTLARAHSLDIVRIAGLGYQFRDDQFLEFFAESRISRRWAWRAGRRPDRNSPTAIP